MKTKVHNQNFFNEKRSIYPQKYALYVIAHLTGGKNGGIAGMK